MIDTSIQNWMYAFLHPTWGMKYMQLWFVDQHPLIAGTLMLVGVIALIGLICYVTDFHDKSKEATAAN